MNIVFAGSPQLAVPCLEALSQQYTIVAVLTSPDKPAGRGKRLQSSEVKQYAVNLNIPILEPEKITDDFIIEISRFKGDLFICFAYGVLLPQRFLDLFPRGCLNVHPSLLPQYRGPSPISAAILNGAGRTGITIQKMVRKMDAGDILRQMEIELDGTETTESLTAAVEKEAPGLLLDTVKGLLSGTVVPTPQDDAEATYCSLIKKSDAAIDWSDSAENISRKIRAYHPWPGAFSFWNGLKIIFRGTASSEPGSEKNIPGQVAGVDKKRGILIQTGHGLVIVTEIQLQSKKNMDFRSFLNGNQNFIGSVLGDHS